MPSILVVDDEFSFRLMLMDFLERDYEVFGAGSGAEALKILAEKSVDLVVSDMCMPEMNGVELTKAIRRHYPNQKIAIMTAGDVDQIIRLVKEEGVSNIIAKTAPFNYGEFEAIVKGLITGEIFGLPRYLLNDGAILAQYRITSSREAREVREQAAALLKERFGRAGDMRLVIDEIITNAVYHAPSDNGGKDKFTAYTDLTLDPGEYVQVECGFDREKCGVSVTDYQGRLTRETVIGKIDRQLSGEGLLDCSGRGLHLSRTFADRMIINIERGQRTEVILLNYFSAQYRGSKPLYINEI